MHTISEMDVLILAGGFGTRIASRAGELPKALIPVCGRPFLAWQLELLRRQGVRSVTYLVGHRAQAIENFLEQWRIRHPDFAVRTLLDPDGEPVGTGRAVRLAVERLGTELSDAFFLSYGDSYLESGWVEAFGQHLRTQSNVMTLVSPATPDTAPNVAWESGRLELYTKKPSVEEKSSLNAVDHGIMILNRKEVLENFAQSGKYDLSQPLEEFSRREKLHGAFLSQHYFEIGTPAGLDRLSEHLWRHTLVLLDRDGVLNAMVARASEPTGQDSPLSPEEILIPSGVVDAVQLLKDAGVSVAICTNQPAAAKGKVTRERLEQVLIEIEKRVGLRDREWQGRYLGAQVCWHRAEDRCACRKPLPLLLVNALAEDRTRRGHDPLCVWMVGDRASDLQAGRALAEKWPWGSVELVGLGLPETFDAIAAPKHVYQDLRTFCTQVGL